MREKRIRTIEVKPIFSLEETPIINLLSNNLRQYVNVINEAILKNYNSLSIGPRLISLEKINSTVINSSILSYPISKAISFYKGKQELAQVPFLLGLLAQQNFLSKVKDIQSIEVIEPVNLFGGKFNRPSQICLRRNNNGWFVDISTYVHKERINETGRESPNSINILVFAKEASEEDLLSIEDLSEKMIG